MKNLKMFITISILLISILVNAHPHVFVDVETRLTTKDEKISAIQILWYYDDMFSLTLFTDFNKDGDNELSKEEVEDLRQGIFARMKDYNYYTHLYIDDKQIRQTPIFNAWVSGERVVFSFLYKLKNTNKDSKFKLQVYDDEYYHAFQIRQDKVSFDGKNPSYTYKLKNIIKELGFYEAEISTLIIEKEKS